MYPFHIAKFFMFVKFCISLLTCHLICALWAENSINVYRKKSSMTSKFKIVSGDNPSPPPVFESPYKEQIRQAAEECIAKNPATCAIVWEDSEGKMYMRWFPESPSFSHGIVTRLCDCVIGISEMDDDGT